MFAGHKRRVASAGRAQARGDFRGPVCAVASDLQSNGWGSGVHGVDQGINVPNLVHEDQIITTVRYIVNNFVVQEDVYTWTLLIPSPTLIDARYNPGSSNPSFNDRTFDYIVTLPPGVTDTSTTLTKTPGDLDAVIVHRSAVQNQDVQICTDCNFDTVRGCSLRPCCTLPHNGVWILCLFSEPGWD